MAKIDTLIYELGIDEKNFNKGIAKAENNFNNFTSQVENLADNLKLNINSAPFAKDIDQAKKQVTNLRKEAGKENKLDINNSEYNRKINDSEREIDQLGDSVKRTSLTNKLGINTNDFNRGIQNAEEQFRTFRNNIIKLAGTIVIGAGITSQVKDAVSTFASFEEAMKQVKTLTDETDVELQKVSDSLLQIAKDGDFSAKELANAYYQALSATGDLTKANVVLNQSVKAAIGGNADLFRSVDGLTSIMNAWKLSNEELTEASDYLFTAVKTGKTTIDEIAGSIGRVAPLASQAGLSLQEVLSAVSALTLQGSSTAEAMTQIRGTLSALIKPSSEAQKMAKELGVEFGATALKSKGLKGVLDELAQATDGDSAKMAKLFGEVEALNGVLALTGKGADDFNKILNDMNDSVGASDEAFNIAEEGLQDTLEALQGLIEYMKIEAAQAFAPFLSDVVETATAFLEWVNNLSDMEKTLLLTSGAMMTIIPLIRKMYTWVLLAKSASMGWVGALNAILTVAGGAVLVTTTLEGISRNMENMGDKAEEAKGKVLDLSDSLKFDSNKVSDISKELSDINTTLSSAKREANNFTTAITDLESAVSDYNNALDNSDDTIDQSKQKINDIIDAYPRLQNALNNVNGKYTIQKEELQNIITLEKSRLESQLSLLKQRKELLQLELNSKDYQRQKKEAEMSLKINEDIKKKAEQDLNALGNMINDIWSLDNAKSQEAIDKFTKQMEEISSNWGELDFNIGISDLKGQAMNDKIDEFYKYIEKELKPTEKYILEWKTKLFEFSEQEAELKDLEANIGGLSNAIDNLTDVGSKNNNENEEIIEKTKRQSELIQEEIDLYKKLNEETDKQEEQIKFTNKLISLTERKRDAEMSEAKDLEEKSKIYKSYTDILSEYQEQLKKLNEDDSSSEVKETKTSPISFDVNKETKKAESLGEKLRTAIESAFVRGDNEAAKTYINDYLSFLDKKIKEFDQKGYSQLVVVAEKLKNKWQQELDELQPPEAFSERNFDFKETETQITKLKEALKEASGERKRLIAEELQSYYKIKAQNVSYNEEVYNILMNYANQYGDELEKLKNKELSFKESALEIMKVIENQPNTIKGLREQIDSINSSLEQLDNIKSEMEDLDLETSFIDDLKTKLKNAIDESENKIDDIKESLKEIADQQMQQAFTETGQLLTEIGNSLGQDWSFFAQVLNEIPGYLKQIDTAIKLFETGNPIGWILLAVQGLVDMVSFFSTLNDETSKSKQLSKDISEQEEEINNYIKERINLRNIDKTALQRVFSQYKNNEKTVNQIKKAEEELQKLMDERKKRLEEAKAEEDKTDFLWWGTDEERVEELENEADMIDEKIDEQRQKIEDLKKEIIDSGEFASALGVGAEDIESSLIDSLKSALSGANTYEDFVRNFSRSMEEGLRNAIIKAMVAKTLQKQIDALVQQVSNAYEDGNLSQEELEALRAAYQALIEDSENIYEDIKKLGFNLGDSGEYSGATEITKSITEETANRMIDYLTTFLIHLQNIEQNTYETANTLKNGVIKVSIEQSVGLTIEEIKKSQGI